MEYQWDIGKERINRHKHGVAFAEAVSVFEDEVAITINDKHLEEDRFVTIGANGLGQVLVVYTYRGEIIRIISARKASSRERKEYEKWK